MALPTDPAPARVTTRRTALKQFTAAGALALGGGTLLEFLAACGAPSGGSTAAPSGQGGSVRLVLPGELRGLDIHTKESSGYLPDNVAIGTCYDSLVDFSLAGDLDGAALQSLVDQGLRPKPLLATDWKVSEDSRTYTFTLRQGVKSRFGNTLTADDVVWSFTKGLSANLVAAFQAKLAGWTSASQVTAVDPQTVRITLAQPSTLLPLLVGTPYFVIFDSTEAKKHATADDPYAAAWLKQNVCGYGRYTVERIGTGGTSFTLKAVDGYYGTAGFPTVQYQAVPEAGQRLQLLLAGQADFATGISPQQGKGLTGNAVYQHVTSANAALLFLDYRTAPWNDPNVRQGIAKALPYQQIIASVYGGSPDVKPMKSVFAPFVQGYTDEFGYTEDLAAAQQLLAPAKGTPLQLAFNSDLETDKQIALLVQAALQKAGLTVNLQGLPTSQWTTQWRGGKLPNTINTLDTPNIPVPYYYMKLYQTKDAFVNYGGYTNAEADQLAQKLYAEQQPAQVTALAKQAQQLAMRDLPVIPIVWTGAFFGLRKGLTITESMGGNATVYGWHLSQS